MDYKIAVQPVDYVKLVTVSMFWPSSSSESMKKRKRRRKRAKAKSLVNSNLLSELCKSVYWYCIGSLRLYSTQLQRPGFTTCKTALEMRMHKPGLQSL